MNFAFDVERPSPSTRRTAARKTAEYDEDDYEDEGGYPPATGEKCPECGAEDWQRGTTRDAECGMCGATFDVNADGEVGRRIGVPPFFEKASSNKESSMDRSNLRQREADILAAMANANLQERRKLAQELNDVQRQRREAIQADRDVDLADTVIRDTLTPVMAHSRSTEDTDWLGEVGLTTEAARDDVHRKMTAEATMWFRNLHEAVIADEEEFAEQAKGKARRVASSYDLIRDEAAQAFLDQAAHLRRKAEVDWEGETGDGAADVADVPTPGSDVADYPQPDTSSNTDDDFGDDDADKTGPKESRRVTAATCGVDPEPGESMHLCDEECGDPSHPHDGLEHPESCHHLTGSKESAKTAGETVAWSGELPDCDICKTEFTSSAPNKAQFDGKTAMGPWAYMCKEHFQALGVGLGTGQGQRLIKEEAKNADMKPPSDDLVDTDIDRYYGDPEGVEGPDTDSQSGHGETQAPANPDEEPAFDDGDFDEDPPKERANQATSPPPGESSRGNNFKPSYSRRRKTAEEGQQWVAEVTGNGENRWSRNALVFDTKEEAEQWLSGLKMRWFGYDMGRVVPADTPRDQSVSETGTEGIYQNFRSGSRKTAARPLHEIARDIESEWDNVNFAARPYLDAMKTLDSINDNYMYDSARSIVAYFLSNASSFRGERAKELKAELKALSKRSSKTAAEGDTCAVCGDSIARDDAQESPSTWHHDNGEKHDHEAKPASSGKESSRRVARESLCDSCGKRKEDVSVAYGPDGGMLDLCDSCLSNNQDYEGYTRTKQSSLQVTDPERFEAFARRLRASSS